MIFLRHPTPDIDAGICYGQTDMEIAEVGYEQIEEALQTTPPLTHIYASPAKRCQKLALALSRRDKTHVSFDERLWEMNMGDFEGVIWDEMDRKISDEWLKDPMNNPPPNGENFSQLQTRVLAAVNEWLDQGLNHATIGVVCHAGPIRALQMAWQGISFKEAFTQAPQYATPIELTPKQ